MDTQHLKLLAGRVRALLADSSIAIGHSQSLDLSAALVGLRNWPEVQAFPSHVAAQEVDHAAAARLSYRLQKVHEYRIDPADLIVHLRPPVSGQSAIQLQVWPSGPKAGVYFTTSAESLAALVEVYQEATDGAVFYAERAAAGHAAAINLGDDGLWSNGLDRVPSGTLVVVGPLRFTQQDWNDATERIEMACSLSYSAGLRLAVLVDSPAPSTVCADAALMLVENRAGDFVDDLVGTIADDGSLMTGVSITYPGASSVPFAGTSSAIPPDVARALEVALASAPAGLLALGSPSDLENPGFDLAVAGLAVTEHMGAAARIMPRYRSTLSKFDLVDPEVAKLPFLPSVQGAYARGYRRFLVDLRYTNVDLIERFTKLGCLFIACSYGPSIEHVLRASFMNYGAKPKKLDWLIAAVVVVNVEFHDVKKVLVDCFIGPATGLADDEEGYQAVFDMRSLRIEEQLSRLIEAGEVSLEQIRQAGADQRILRRLSTLLPQ
jgi:hypothetical protein